MEELEAYRQREYSLDELVVNDEWGTLYRATYLPHGRRVLLRDLAPSVSSIEGARDLLLAEVGAWARLDHPGVLQVLDRGSMDDRCYFATMHPDGVRLEDVLLADRGVEGAERIFKSLLEAVEAARRMGVLHLGLGAGNVWVVPSGRVQVAEFGLWYAAREYPALGIDGAEFPAPEQQGSGRASAATDVYALALIYIALRHGLEAARAAAACGAAPPELGERKQIIDRCLEPSPLLRSLSAGELSDELETASGRSGGDESTGCPLCALQKEMLRRAECSNLATPGAEDTSRRPRLPTVADVLPRVLIAALVVLAVLVWWLALR